MQLSHRLGATSVVFDDPNLVSSVVFDDPNLVSSAGLLPEVALAQSAGLRELADERLTVPTDKGSACGTPSLIPFRGSN
jgi:hypothetical protein